MCRKHFIEMQKETNPQLDEVTVKALAMSGKKIRASCSVDGCTKQSQGASHNNMCRSHYLEAGGTWKGKKSPTPKKKKASPKKKKTPARKSDGAYKSECKVEGCTKLSQGARNGHMCRRHFSLSTKVAGDGTDAAAASDGPPTEQDLGTLAAVTIAQGPKKQIRPSCAVPGCPKQSQGKSNGGMCRSHFREMQKAGVPLEVAAGPPALPNPSAAAASAEAGTEIPPEDEDPELNEMIAKEIERIKKRDRGDSEDHGVEDYLGGDDDDDDGATAAPGPTPKRGRKGAPPPSTPSEPFLRRQQARDAVDALKAELQAAVSKEISLMAAMEGMTECILCQDEPKAVAMVPCGHLAICSDCKFTENRCPICLEPIEDRAVAAV